ncbi:hypothetical protein [Bifidobacterium sp. ESL0764]|uniref:hypothetical protein n=1 Tax=Bifidobacterium sp. ESL0764 TaxID=2983228 RepID=UPI0023FA2722|nr:hypothetical protein [Bifidobacterium sp. ESL0764]WEV65733.1 hypothetical protein OZX71_08315 [Bifidobacterium sp. ESL0764]
MATSIIAAIVLVITAVLPVTGSASYEQSLERASDNSWRVNSTDSVHNNAIRKPELYQLLSFNNKIDTLRDEMRLDFVVRVAHGEVDPTVSNGGNTGLRIVYDYGDGGVSGNTVNPNYGHTVSYKRTIFGSDVASGADTWAQNIDEYYTIVSMQNSGPYDYVTVSLQGDMNIPDENNAYWSSASDNGQTWKQHIWAMVGPLARSSSNWLDGYITSNGNAAWSGVNAQRVTDYLNSAPASQFATNLAEGKDETSYPGICHQAWGKTYSHGCDIPQSWVGFDRWPRLWSNDGGDGTGQTNWGLTVDAGFNNIRVARNGKTNSGSKSYPAGTAPPNSFFIRWYNPANSSKDAARGGGQRTPDPCTRVTGFKYQWLGLQNRKNWVPVTSLTPEPVEVSNVPVTGYDYTAGTDFPIWADNGDGSFSKLDNEAKFTDYTAFNSVSNYEGNTKPYNLMVQGAGSATSAQNADGSIDFDKAKRLQPNDDAEGTVGSAGYSGLDGYFKLVTWPVVDSSCTLNDPLRNPDKNSEGITQEMAENDQASVQKQIDAGWTVGTAFDHFDINRPKVPTITGVSTDDSAATTNEMTAITNSSDPQYALADSKAKSNATKPVISGNATIGDWVVLYEDVPNRRNSAGTSYADRVIKKNAPGTYDNGDDYESVGTVVNSENPPGSGPNTNVVGAAAVGKDGTWHITDNTAVDSTQINERVRRYHAYQYDPTDEMKVGSHFSPIALVNFSAPADKAPTVDPDKIVVPHTKQTASLDGALTDGNNTTVSIGGTMSSTEGGSTMRLYAKHVAPPSDLSKTLGKSASSPVAARDGDSDLGNEIVGVDSAKCEQSIGVGSDKDWSCSVPVQWFIDNTPSPVAGTGCYFKFVAVTTNKDGVTAQSEPVTKSVDFYAPVVSITSADNSYVKGKVTADPDTPVIVNTILPGATVHLSWPDGTPSGAPTTATVDSEGNWKAEVVSGAKPGDIKAYVVDKETNASKKTVYKDFNPTPPVTALPFTGHFPWLAILMVLTVIVMAIVGYKVLQKYKGGLLSKGRHVK